MKVRLLLSLFLFFAGVGCTGASSPTPTSQPTVDPYFAAQGVGEPRGIGYWLLWNSCAPDNRAETAAANGGREAGWFLMDDVLANPGVLLGDYSVATCNEGVRLLQGATGSADDAAYPLAAQLLAAQLNLAAGAEYCPASDETVQAAQRLLLSSGFDGSGKILGPEAGAEALLLAEELEGQLALYNAGTLCR